MNVRTGETLSFAFIDDALQGAECRATSKATGKVVRGKLQALDEDGSHTLPTVRQGQVKLMTWL